MTVISMRNFERDAAAEPAPVSVEPVQHERAFRALVIEHAPHLLRVLRSLGVPSADVEDLCQETFLVAHRKLASFEARSSVRTWLCGIALRVASGHRKKAYHRRERGMDLLPEAQAAAQQENLLEVKRAWALVERLLEPLSRERREVFVLYEIAELSVPEIAKLLGVPEQTAYSRLHAARQHVERGMSMLRKDRNLGAGR
jgi:RNA polymerase sigma-70 factor (ECF subfamily)